jgi:hypothetical protein
MDTEQVLLDRLLASVAAASGGIIATDQLCVFAGMKGALATGQLMVVGRAVNSWPTLWDVAGLREDDYRARAVRETLTSVRESTACPMLWVSKAWRANLGYNTRRSAFWRTVRRTIQALQIADIADASWPSHLTWTNLYKVAPAKGGNPGSSLRRITLPHCKELLRFEFEQWAPMRLLLLTGMSWAHPFLESLGFVPMQNGGTGLVEAVGSLTSPSSGLPTNVVVAQHPQGKPEERMVCEILSAFGRQSA